MSPTPSVNSFTAYRKRIAKSAVPTLGELVFFSVAENFAADHAAMEADCKRLGLEKFTPKVPKDIDVFRRVCTNAARKRVPVDGADVFENYLMRDVKTSDGHAWKQLVVETVDGENRRLDYEPVLELEFDPEKPNKIVVNWLVTPQPKNARSVLDEIVSQYKFWRGKVHAYSMRSFLRDVVASTNATMVKQSGGLYFVMESKFDTISALDEIVTKHASTEDFTTTNVSFDTVPLIDDSRTKEMLRAAFEDEAIRSIKEFQDEVDDLVGDDGTITDAKFASLAAKKNAIKAKAEEYATLLDDNLNGTSLRMRALEASLKKAYRKIG